MQCLFSNHKAKKNVNIKIPLRKKKQKNTRTHATCIEKCCFGSAGESKKVYEHGQQDQVVRRDSVTHSNKCLAHSFRLIRRSDFWFRKVFTVDTLKMRTMIGKNHL